METDQDEDDVQIINSDDEVEIHDRGLVVVEQENAGGSGSPCPPKLKTTSRVWIYYECTPDVLKVKCKICAAIITRGNKKCVNTTNMRTHLQGKHKKEFEQMKLNEEDAASQKNKEKVKSDESILTALNKQKKWAENDNRAMTMNYKIGEMIATDNEPYSVVERIGFSRLMNHAVPSYNIPCRTTFTKKIIPDIYRRCVVAIAAQIDKAIHISFTSDIWTESHTNESFIAFTAHYLTENFDLEKAVLHARHFPGHHTGENIANALNSMLLEWKVAENRFHLIVRDNAANMKKGTNDAGLDSVSCFLHTLQLVIEDSIKSQRAVSDMIAVCRNIVTHFNHSAAACSDLRKTQANLQLPQLKPIQDVSTRWNSTYYMLERILELKNSLSVFAASSTITNLTKNQWDLLSATLSLLQPFEEITKAVSKSESVISEVIPTVATLKKYLSTTNDSHKGVGTMKDTLGKSLCRRFDEIIEQKNYFLATYLDPRYKSAFFEEHTTDIQNKIQDLVREARNGQSGSMVAAAPTPSTPSPPKRPRQQTHESFWNCYDEISKQSGLQSSGSGSGNRNTSNDEIVKEEMRLYCSFPLVRRNGKPFQWWKENGKTFPVLKTLALKFLSAPASSVCSERLFSETGIIYEDTRNRLLPRHGEELAFCNYNLRYLNFKY